MQLLAVALIQLLSSTTVLESELVANVRIQIVVSEVTGIPVNLQFSTLATAGTSTGINFGLSKII